MGIVLMAASVSCTFFVQGLEIVRGCRGLNLVGCDLVEVSPPYDTTGTV